MKQKWISLVMLCIGTFSLAAFAAEDQVLTTQVGEVEVALLIPGDVPVLRGLYVHAAHGISAVWERPDGSQGAANPGLVVVRKKPVQE